MEGCRHCFLVSLHSTPTDYLVNLASIHSAELPRQRATRSLAYRSLMNHLSVNCIGLTTADEERLRFQQPFVPAARKLLNESNLN